MRKSISFVLAFVFCCFAAFFASCGCNGQEEKAEGGRINDVEISETEFIVESGKSDYTVLISADYSETEYFAATELQSFIFQTSGVKIPISFDVAFDVSANGKFFSIGDTRFFKEKNFDLSDGNFRGDAFIIKTDGGNMYFKGANDRGTLYGVYDYIERVLGVRFVASDCTYVPKLDRINFYEINVFDYPAFNIRMYITGVAYNDPLFLARKRMGNEMVNIDKKYGGKIGWNTTDPHTTLYYVPVQTYFTEANKEINAHMYALNSSGVPFDLCMTDGVTEDGEIDESMEVSAIKVALESLKERVRNSAKDCEYYIFSQMDTTSCCNCPRCELARTKYKTSGIYVRFANLLCREINKWSKEEYDGRTVKLVMFAYQATEEAPINADGSILDESCRPDENVYIRIAPISADAYYPFTDKTHNVMSINALFGWSAITDNIMIWSYHFNAIHVLWPFITTHTFKDNLSLFEQFGAEYVLMQADYINRENWQDKINTYVASAMLWNPDRDAVALRDEFISLYYGAGADNVSEFIDLIEEKMYEISLEGKDVSRLYETTSLDSKYYPIGYLEGLDNLLKEGIEKVRSSDDEEKEETEKRIRQIRLTPLYMLIYNIDNYYSTDTVKKMQVVREFVNICEEFNITFLGESFNGKANNLNALKIKYGI